MVKDFHKAFSICLKTISVLLLFTFPGQLDKNLGYYEVLHADHDLQHSVVKRGAKPSSHPFNVIKEVTFETLGRKFRLILHPHKEVLHSNFQAYTVDENLKEKVVHVGEYLKEHWIPAAMLIICFRS